MKVFIITEGGAKTGLGHITRCLAIYQAFEKRGICPNFIINGSFVINEMMKGVKFQTLNWIIKKNILFKRVRNADIIIIDSYLAGLDIYEKLANTGKMVVYIDDSNRLIYPKGVVVNATVQAKNLNFGKNNFTIKLLGKDYALFRKEFWSVQIKQTNKKLSNVLLFFGGADIRQIGVKISKYLNKDYPNLKKKFIVGHSMKTNNIIKNMLLADFAITTGGQTLYELVRVGIPTIAIAVNDSQAACIKALKNNGVLYVGKWNDKDLRKNIKKYIKILQPHNIRKKKSEMLRKIFNGKSTLYLIDELIKLYKRRKNE
jgi:UDP-2,4-diacetamido-2,4,6-trideoxy-beta-L-altropyranose hydrolase